MQGYLIKKNNKKLAIFWMTISCFLGSIINILVKSLTFRMPSAFVVASYNLGCCIIVGTLMFIIGISPKTRKFYLHFSRAFLSSMAYVIYFTAQQKIAIACAVAITFIDPMLTCLFAYLLLKDKLETHNLVGLVVGFIGALFVIKPGTSLFQISSVTILISSIFWALGNVITKMLTETENSLTQIFYISLITSICAFIIFYITYDGEIEFSRHTMILMHAASVVTLIHYFTLYKTLSYANPSVIMPFYFMNIIFGEMLGYILFNETLDKFELIGISIIILINIYLLFQKGEQRQEKQKLVSNGSMRSCSKNVC